MIATFKVDSDAEAMRIVKSRDMAQCLCQLYNFILTESSIPETTKEFIFGIYEDKGINLNDLTEP